MKSHQLFGLFLLLGVGACGGGVTSEPASNAGTSSSGGSSSGGTSGGVTPGAGVECATTQPPADHSHHYDPSALPTGACSGEAACSLAVIDCACGNYPDAEYRCSCESGEWACARADGTANNCLCANDSGISNPPPNGCSYAPDENDPLCPSAFSTHYQGTECPKLGLACSYAGQGNLTESGCPGTATLRCSNGNGAMDIGADGGTGTWLVSR